MVKISTEDVDTEVGGPCEKIMDQKWDVIQDIVSLTSAHGHEYAVGMIIPEGESEVLSTDWMKGDESGINTAVHSTIKVDTMSLPGTTFNWQSSDKFFIHTHPSGIPELSATDIKGIIEGMKPVDKQDTAFDAQLVAAELEDGISLAGLYRESIVSEKKRSHLSNVLAHLESPSTPDHSPNFLKERLIEELVDVGYRWCHVVGPKNG